MSELCSTVFTCSIYRLNKNIASHNGAVHAFNTTHTHIKLYKNIKNRNMTIKHKNSISS